MKRYYDILFAIVAIAVALSAAACLPSPPPLESASSAALAVSAAVTPLPTRTAVPTRTPQPTWTAVPRRPTMTPFPPCTTPTLFYADNVKSISQCGAVITASFDLSQATPFPVPTFPAGWKPCGASGQGLDASTSNVQSWECVDGSENNVGVYYVAVAYNDYLDFQATPTATGQ